MITNPRYFNEDYNPEQPTSFDNHKFCSIVEAAVYMLNMSIDKSQYPLDVIQERTTQLRPIGIGIMGLADAFLQFGFDYGDEGSVGLTKHIGTLLMETASAVSADIAAVEGPFPMDYLIKEEHKPKRNIRLTAIAPTGTISLMADCSPGVEPNITSPGVTTTRLNISKRDLTQQSKWTGVLESIPTIYNTSPDAQFAVLAALANTIDGGISKTMAMPFESTPNDIYNIIQKAWISNLCGITFFRHGCRKVANLQEFCNCGGLITYDSGCRTCSKCGRKSCSV
jgi:ribonucleoside-diphosphate reductase alpha chain